MPLISEIDTNLICGSTLKPVMNLDLDLTNFNGGGGMPMECNNMRSMPEKRSKTYDDPARMVNSMHHENFIMEFLFISFKRPRRGRGLKGRQTCWRGAGCWISP